MTVAVVGLGKIGLPLAVQIAGSGHRVIGCDISLDVVSAVNAAAPHFPGEAELPERLDATVSSGNLHATTDTSSAVRDADVVIVVVPLVVDAAYESDFGSIDAATEDVARGLTPNTLVIWLTL